MTIYQKLLDFDSRFNSLTRPPIIINDVVDSSEEEKERLKQLIFSYYHNDVMSTVPSCDCGETTAEYNIGVICTNCGTECQSQNTDTLESTLWMRSPIGVEKLINPTVWYILNNRFKVSSFEFIHYFADTTYKPPGTKVPKELAILENAGFKRGYNNFVRNFDALINMLLQLLTSRKAVKEDPIIRFLNENRSKIFSSYLPLPNKSILIVEDAPAGKFVDPLVVGAINAIQIIASVDSVDSATPINIATLQTYQGNNTAAQQIQQRTVDDLTQRSKENRAIKAIHELSEFYAAYYGNALARKPGLFRRQIFGTRSHFSFRAVISSITCEHNYDEIHIPWAVGIGVLRIHILNKLDKLGFTVTQALTKLNYAVEKYDPLIDNIFRELIEESPDKGIPVTLGRNPSLMRGSIQALRITRVKTNLGDPTIGISILVVNGLNADFDGELAYAVSKLF